MREYEIKGTSFKIRYQDLSGTQIPIVFIHGLGCAGSYDYPHVAAHPSIANHRRILVDLLGAGYSDKPSEFPYNVGSHAAYLKDFIIDLKLEEFILFGHSLGGAIAIELAALCKDRISHLILSEANLDPSGDAEELAQHDIKIGIVENAGHSMAWENPSGLSKAIEECLSIGR